MPPSVKSQVPTVELQESGAIVVTVQVAGFQVGKCVEVYGYVTQDSGAFGSFRQTQEVPQPNGKPAPQITVTIPPKTVDLKQGEKVTVVTWVSEIWPSILDPDKDDHGDYTPSWTIDQAASDAYRTYAPCGGRW